MISAGTHACTCLNWASEGGKLETDFVSEDWQQRDESLALDYGWH
jgi:hypothetical protein